MDRLTRYRDFMRRLDVTDAAEAIQKDLYVAPPGGSVADRIVSSAMLRPYASQVLVGGIGAGKTTQLLVAQSRIIQAEQLDTSVFYVDVSEHHPLEQLEPGVLTALAGVALAQTFPNQSVLRRKGTDKERSITKASERFRHWASGHWRERTPEDDYDDEYNPHEYKTWVRGKLKPRAPLMSEIAERLDDLKTLRDALPEDRRHVLLLFDSLDRIENMDAFVRVIDQDLRALRQLEIGVVTTAPLQTLFGKKRAELDRFDVLLHQPAVDVAADAAGSSFLVEVLLRRAPEGLLEGEAASSLATASGGVLRDLIALARSAAEEAYMRGADTIGVDHVAAAIDRFGRKRMLGLRSNEIDLLRRVQATSRFVPATDDELALLVTRRVLEYQEEPSRFAVHPTLVPLLNARRDAA